MYPYRVKYANAGVIVEMSYHNMPEEFGQKIREALEHCLDVNSGVSDDMFSLSTTGNSRWCVVVDSMYVYPSDISVSINRSGGDKLIAIIHFIFDANTESIFPKAFREKLLEAFNSQKEEQ